MRLLFVLIVAFFSFQAGAQVVDVLMLSQPGGHASVANRMEQVLSQNGLKVKKLDLPEFLPALLKDRLHSMAMYTHQNLPAQYHLAYENYLSDAETHGSISELSRGKIYDTNRFLQTLRELKPRLVLVPFATAMEFLETMRLNKEFMDLPIGFFPTDYGTESYFTYMIPMVADMTFSPHPQWTKEALKRGVPIEKIIDSGMPCNPKVFDNLDKTQIKKLWENLGFDPKVKTVLLASGSAGTGDLATMIKTIEMQFGGRPIQIIAATGKNEELYSQISTLKGTVSKNIKIHVMGFDPTMPYYMKYVADVVVSKPGGLTVTEVANMAGKPNGKPKGFILISPAQAQEAANLDFFVKQGMAISADPAEVGPKIRMLFDSPTDLIGKMDEAQRSFALFTNVDKVTAWVRKTIAKQNSEGGTKPTFSNRKVRDYKGLNRITSDCRYLSRQLGNIADNFIHSVF